MDQGQSAPQDQSHHTTGPPNRYKQRHQRRDQRAAADTISASSEQAQTLTTPSQVSGGGRKSPAKKKLSPENEGNSRPDQANLSRTRPHKQPLPRQNQAQDHLSQSIDAASGSTPSDAQGPQPRSRRAKFRSNLTQSTDDLDTSSKPPRGSSTEHRKSKPKGPPAATSDDLTSTLIHAIRTPPFPDCSICFNPIRPEQPTWSCHPPDSRVDTLAGDESEEKPSSHCCWTTIHLKCIRSWAEKSVRDLAEAWRARGEDRPGEWRCPGCQAKRLEVPRSYWCFCHRLQNPTTPRHAIPHSCAQSCTRPSACEHSCPLQCHPGPCRPCGVTVRRSCFCGKVKRSVRCSATGSPVLSASAGSFSCTKSCDRPLSCGNPAHRCSKPCHPGGCPPCTETEQVRCWCGRVKKTVTCGELPSVDGIRCTTLSRSGEGEEWFGLFGCNQPCNRPFACMHHSCPKLCHPPSPIPPPCPFDPERVTRCACGRCRVAPTSGLDLGSASTEISPLLPARTSCTSPLPTCTSPCSKPLPCGHVCKSTCHWGTCPPCTEQVERACRCGSSKRQVPCGHTPAALSPMTSESSESPVPFEILCNRPCPAFRACGKHRCSRICCPLASIATQKGKAKKRRDGSTNVEVLGTEEGGLHECDLNCGKVMPCGNHRCKRKDHKGPCGVCLKSVFEELLCPCGRTILDPPIPCGTRLNCIYPCARPTQCGHPIIPHTCHEAVVIAGADTADDGLGPSPAAASDAGSCPPCPILTKKLCDCRKRLVDNVRCSQAKVSCGIVCGRLLSCGFHRCERSCHADECGPCTAVCGKARKSCLPEHHSCTQVCHAPAACPETEPCLSPVTLTCPCGHLRSTVPCSATKHKLQCSGECAKMKRSAQLAEAFGITEDKRREGPLGKVVWSDELVTFGKLPANTKFVRIVEKAFEDFISSNRRTQVLPHMPPERRKFVHDVAAVYRMDTAMVDEEPHRSVQLIRRIDTRIPMPLLSQRIATAVAARTPSLGKLVDLRSTSSPSSVVGGRWSGVVGKLAQPPTRTPSPSAGDSGSRSGSFSVLTPSGAAAWVSPSVRALRAVATSEEALSAASVPGMLEEKAAGRNADSAVPDDWEDDS